MILFFQDALQFYDTPRNLLIENAPVQQQLVGPYANYDMPQQPLPVYRKPCGCIMKLIKLESKYSTMGRIMCNWLKSIGDWKSIGKFFDKNSEIFLQFTLLVVNHVDWVKSIAINETQLELP